MLKKRKLLPPLDYLAAFEAAAKHASFARAARELNVSESAVSRKIRLLEQHYNLPLFVRSHRSVALTEQGSALLASVGRALDILRGASSDMFSLQKANAVTLAATNSVAALWLMPRLRKFNAANEQVRIRLVASDSDEECLAETMDLTILRGDGDWPGYTTRLLFGETIFPVCSAGYLKQNPGAADLNHLPALDLIEVSSRHPEWMDWKTWLSRQGLSDALFDRSAFFNTYPLAIQAAVDGLGIALGWGHLVDRLIASGDLVRPLGDRAVRTQSGYYLLSRTARPGFPEQRIVQDWLIRESAARRRYGSGLETTAN